MPTISQLPPASSVSADDELPISQGGAARATSVGVLLSSTQPVIIVDSPSLLGRQSLGSGSPEQIDIGTGIALTAGTLVADGLDHATFPSTSSLSAEAELVISNQGTPMLMQTSLLRGLFSAGQNVAIDPNGVISAPGVSTGGGTIGSVSSFGSLQVVTALSSQDLVAVSHSGSEAAISYGNFLDGITIDQAQPATAVGDTDTTWVAQGSNVMASQTFSAIWVWIASKLATYKTPVVEITANTNLDTTVHNGRLLICSQPITLTPLTTNMGNGFHCTIINASSGNLTLGSSFITSNGSLILSPWQYATLSCLTYSGGTIAFAAMPTTGSGTTTALPGQVTGLAMSAETSSTITVAWQAPSTGGVVSSYQLQYRVTGTTSWANSVSIAGATTYQLTSLQAATSYDIQVQAENAAGFGAVSSLLTVTTSGSSQNTTPPQVSGLTASPLTTSSIQLSWSAQTGSAAATSFTAQYRITGSSAWTSSITGLTGTGATITGLQASTSYDFEVTGLNAAGTGLASSVVTGVTFAATQSVSSITWLVLPSGTYTHGSGSIGVNADVSPASAPIQFGFSQSATTPPTNWTVATFVNTNLWGAYLATPATAGSWFVWAEGLDGSARIVSPSAFTVQ